MNPRRPIIDKRVESLWNETQSYKHHSKPVTIHIPLGSYLRFAAIAIPLIVVLLVMWPNP